MICAVHLGGTAIVYNSGKPGGRKLYSGPLPPSRIQGSLYSQQKRAIVDACEYLRLNARKTPGRAAIILTLTSPGFVSAADEPRFLKRFFDNLKKNYDLGDYVWVREYTKAGYPHFHCVADWHSHRWYFGLHPGTLRRRIAHLSIYWSGLFGRHSDNSVWVGSRPDKQGKRLYELRDRRHAWYLTKYLGKDIKPDYATPVPVAGIAPIPVIASAARPVPLPYLNTCAKYPHLSDTMPP